VIICGSVKEIRETSRAVRREGRKIALVPTMGYLHEGHVSLVRKANNRADFVVVSIFVNPTQFGPEEDFDRYPRDFERDRVICEEARVDALFCPQVEEIYPRGYSTFVEIEGRIVDTLCGARRPGHFRGVATVVSKLFLAVEPDMAVFGQKDAQQCAVIRKMTRDLDFPVEIVVSPIVREKDGLAMSSRNKYLDPGERQAAPLIKKGLDLASKAFGGGERLPAKLKQAALAEIGRSALLRTDYLEIVDGETLEPLETLSGGRPALLAAAVFCGKTRLIDNIILGAQNGN